MVRRVYWKEMDEFPDYSVSDHGDIVNIKTGTPRKISVNQQGIPKISMYNARGKLVTRSVGLLVADAFVQRPAIETFDTPIHLDGDRMNCEATNLVWRPRWFAIKFHKQFRDPNFYAARTIIRDRETEEMYLSVRDACVSNGLYWFDVVKSFTEGTKTFPTWQIFDLAVEEDDAM